MDSRSVVRLVLLFIFLLKSIQAYTPRDLTIRIPAGAVECFYQTVKDEKKLDIVYQVTAGGQLDVEFRVTSPSGKILFDEGRKKGLQRYEHRVEEAETGDYEICFSNRFSHLSSKTVYFGVSIDSDIEDLEAWKGFVEPDEDFGEQLESMKEEMSSIKSNMARTVQAQSQFRAYEKRDRSMAERNFELVNLWSGINVVVMMTVFSLQVYMIRSMFTDGMKVRP